MKKLIFLLIPLLLTNLVSSCALQKLTNDSEIVKVTNESEIVKQKTLRQIEQAKERAEQKLTPQKQDVLHKQKEYPRTRQELEYAKARAIQEEQELYNREQKAKRRRLEEEAKYKRFKEEWIEFIQSGDDSIKNKTTQEVKKLVGQWNLRWAKRVGMVQTEVGMVQTEMGEPVTENAKKIFLEDFSLENFYKMFGKPWKTQFIENEYFLWFTCKDGIPVITVRVCNYDDGWVNILDLNIL